MNQLAYYNNNPCIVYYEGEQYLGWTNNSGYISLIFIKGKELLRNTEIIINGKKYLTDKNGKILLEDDKGKTIDLRIIYDDTYAEFSASYMMPYTDRIIDMSQKMQGSITWKWTNRSSHETSLKIPFYANIIRVAFTWHYNSDERARLGSLTSACGIKCNESGKLWNAQNHDVYVRVTPGKEYTFTVWVDGYKSRDYGFTLYWGTDLNSVTPHMEDL